MDLEFQEVKEFVGYEVDGAVEVALDAKVEFEGPPGFVARGEGDVLELARGVGDLWRCVRMVGGRIVKVGLECVWGRTCSPVSLRRD